MLPEIHTRFCITGTSISPDQITNLLGFSPTQTWILGDPIQGTRLSRKHNGWCYSVGGAENTLDLGRSVSALVNHLVSYSQIISDVCSKHKLHCEVSCAVYIVDETPIINLDPETISGLACLNASLDIDIILSNE